MKVRVEMEVGITHWGEEDKERQKGREKKDKKVVQYTHRSTGKGKQE